jgi:uncharacterized protein (DUF736 family)
MAYEQRPNTGVMFKNRKTKDSQPDYAGNCLVNGVTMRVAAWTKPTKNGGTFLSLSFTDPRPENDAPPAEQQPNERPSTPIADADIPF